MGASSGKAVSLPLPRRSKSKASNEPCKSAQPHLPTAKKPQEDDDASVSTRAHTELSINSSQALSGLGSTIFCGTDSRGIHDLDEIFGDVEHISRSRTATTPSEHMLLPCHSQPTSPRAPSFTSEGPCGQAPKPTQGSRWTLDQLRILKTVGVGFMGSVRVVMRADSSDETCFALKIMKKAEVIKRRQVEHCNQERELLGQVDHPFIVRLLGTFQDPARIFMLMEFVNGGELFSLLSAQGRLQNDGAKLYTAEVTLALGYLHSYHIAYRDLKPENILLDSHGHTKITDFGFAKVVPTRTYTKCGTPEYLAPEIILISGHGLRADWWALGILIFEMLTGFTPFQGGKTSDLNNNILHGEVKYPSAITCNAKNLIEKLLIRDPTRRLGSSAGDSEDIKSHRWFAMVDWSLVLDKKYQPPHMPPVEGQGDMSRFDSYPEEEIDLDLPSGITDDKQHLFKDF